MPHVYLPPPVAHTLRTSLKRRDAVVNSYAAAAVAYDRHIPHLKLEDAGERVHHVAVAKHVQQQFVLEVTYTRRTDFRLGFCSGHRL
jgi:hypothetical protein